MKNDLRMKGHPILDVKRGKMVRFYYNGMSVIAYDNETIAAALFATGFKIFSRSFKYHRPRGPFCMSGHCSNCLMRVDGIPNVRTCTEPVRSKMRVESQNAWPSLKFDLLSLSGIFDFFIRPGFQYKRFIRLRWAYHIWEKALRRIAGIGTLADVESPVAAKRVRLKTETVVVGGGIAGLSAAMHAAQAGSKVLLVEKEDMLGGRRRYDTTIAKVPESQNEEHQNFYMIKLAQKVKKLPNCSVLEDATAFAWYDEGILAVSRSNEFWEVEPGRLVIATGSYQNPLVFENNDLPGIFLSGGVQRLMHRFYIRPGKQAVVATCNAEGYIIAQQLLDAGVKVTGIVDNRSEKEIYSSSEAEKIRHTKAPIFSGHNIKAATGRRQINGVVFSNHKLPCDVLCIAGSRTPANELVFQCTCKGEYMLESPNQFTRKALIDPNMKVDTGIYVAGGTNGSNETNRSWLEGKIAGLSAAIDLGYGGKAAEMERNDAIALLSDLPKGNGLL